MPKKSLILVATWLLILLTVFGRSLDHNQVWAIENVDVSLKSRYELNPPHTTLVTHTITLKNLDPTVNVNQFAFEISNPHLSQIIVESSSSLDDDTHTPSDQDENHTPPLVNNVSTDTSTSIGLTFQDDVIGQDQTRTITIGYTDQTTAAFTDNSGFMYIPALVDQSTYDSYQIEIVMPSSLADMAIQPSTTQHQLPEINQANQDQDTVFSLSPNPDESLTLYFGNNQPVSFELNYQLLNQTDSPSLQQILLPPNTPYQTIFLDELTPKPEKISIDHHGNWLASYRVDQQSSQEVIVTGQADIMAEADSDPERPTRQYLAETSFWPVGHDQLTSWLEQQNLSTQNSLYEITESILQQTYSQDATSDATLDASFLGELDSSQPIMMAALPNLAISTFRTFEYPSRRAIGLSFAFDEQARPALFYNQKLHSWLETWTGHTWQQIDPIWGLSTGGQNYVDFRDVSKLTLAYHGGRAPYPEPTQLRSATVQAISQIDQPALQVAFSLQPRKIWGITLPGQYLVTIDNQSGQSILNQALKISGVFSPITMPIDEVLPYQSTQVVLKLKTNDWFAASQDDVQLQLHDQTENFQLQHASKISHYLLGWPGLSLGFTLIIITLGAGSLLVFRR